MDQPAPKQRINGIWAGFLIALAILFDILQLGTKILHLLGGFLVASGAALAPFTFGASIALGAAAAAVWVLEIVISLAITIIGYLTIGWILLMRGVSPIGGKHTIGDMVWLFATLTFELVPFLNALPGLSLWTVRKIIKTRHEDKAMMVKYKKAQKDAGEQRIRHVERLQPAHI